MAVDKPVEAGPVTDSPVGTRAVGKAVPAAIVAIGVLLLAMVVRYALALDLPGPWLMGDELRYSEMAKSFLDEGRLLFREEPIPFATAYPALIAPAWAASDMATTYEIAKAINVVLMTCSALIVFLWMRRITSVTYAFVAGGFVLLMPTFTYTGMLMTENAALPAFLLAVFGIALALERPTLGRQAVVLVLIGIAALIRVQVITLALVYPTAIVLDALFAHRAGSRMRASLARFVPSFALMFVGSLVYVAFEILSGSSLTSGLGAYSTVGEVHYDWIEIVRWSVWHAGELVLSVAVLPAMAFGALVAAAIRRGSLPTQGERAFVAVAAAATFWFVLQAAAYASRFSGRIEERYMVYAAPLLLMALAAWLWRGAPRAGVSTYVAAVVPALLAATVPYERLFNIGLVADTFGLIPFMRLSSHLKGGIEDLRIVVAGGLIVAAISFAVLSLRLARVLFPLAVALVLTLSGYTVHGAIQDQSAAARAAQGVSDASWVDHRLGQGGRAAFIYGPSAGVNPHMLWQTEFWNRSIRRVYPLDTDRIASYSDDEVVIDSSGRLVPKGAGRSIDEPYALADPGLGIKGELVARQGPLARIEVDPPARVGSAGDGVYPDGWSGPAAGLTQYAPLAGGAQKMRVRVSRAGWSGPDVPSRVTISAGPLKMTDAGPTLTRTTSTREWVVHSGLTKTFVLPVPPAPFRLEVKVSPTFSPAQFGQADARQLGVQLSFAPESG
jgi:hypothetical protein